MPPESLKYLCEVALTQLNLVTAGVKDERWADGYGHSKALLASASKLFQRLSGLVSALEDLANS